MSLSGMCHQKTRPRKYQEKNFWMTASTLHYLCQSLQSFGYRQSIHSELYMKWCSKVYTLKRVKTNVLHRLQSNALQIYWSRSQELSRSLNSSFFDEGENEVHHICNKVARTTNGGSSLDNWRQS